jgi:hypothetical protein
MPELGQAQDKAVNRWSRESIFRLLARYLALKEIAGDVVVGTCSSASGGMRSAADFSEDDVSEFNP